MAKQKLSKLDHLPSQTRRKKKKKKRKKTEVKNIRDFEEEKPKGVKLARRGETSPKAKAKKGFSSDEMLKRIL